MVKNHTLIVCVTGEDDNVDMWLIPEDDIGSAMSKQLDKMDKTGLMMFTPDDAFSFSGGPLRDGEVITRVVLTYWND